MSYYNAVMCINWVQTPLSQLNIQCIHSLKCGEKNRSLTRVVGCNLQGKVNYLLKGQDRTSNKATVYNVSFTEKRPLNILSKNF